MLNKKEIVLLIWQVYWFSFSNSTRFDCEWGSEYLCGDNCTRVTSKCVCGNELILYEDSGTYSCCNSKPCEVFETNVTCEDGIKQYWGEPCYTDCIQMAQYGFSTLQCDDWSECYMTVNACRGTNECDR